MLESWRLGTPRERNQLLGNLFDALHVTDGELVAYTPREDRVAEVVELVEAAIGHREVQAVAGGAPTLRAFAGAEREGFEPAPTNYEIRFL
jgi:hypothetical protein